MNATLQKISWAQRAIAELRNAERVFSRDDFQYHYGMFLAQLGALRQFIQPETDPKRLFNLETDPYYCACVDLRNVEFHVFNTLGSARAKYDVNITITTKLSASLTATTLRADGSREDHGELRATAAATVPGESGTQTTTVCYFVDPAQLPGSFGSLNPKGTKTRDAADILKEKSILASECAADVAEKALDFFIKTLLPVAQTWGEPIP